MRLTDCFIEVIAYVAYFINTVTVKQTPFDQVKADVHRLLSESERHLQDGALSQEDFDSARFAICAWVDETILSSSWDSKGQWQGEQLQRLYYRTADAGEMFFDRLNTLGPHQGDVREVYYLCLAMGFMGRYCHEGDSYLLDQLKTSNLKLLMGSSMGLPSLDRTDLFPEAYPPESDEASMPQKKFAFSSLTLICISGPVILYWVLFLIYRFVLNSIGKVF